MERDERAVIELLKQHGAEEVRNRKHRIWRLPDGRTWASPSTPSDHRTWLNQLSDLRKFLGINEVKGCIGERREKKRKQPRKLITAASLTANVGMRTLYEQLKSIRTARPVYASCFAHERRVVLKTVVTVWMERLFG